MSAAGRGVDLRASQEERERVVERLRAHAGEGRLELDELEERVEAALAARTRGELDALLADLPRAPRSPERRTRAAWAWLPLLAGIAIVALAPHGVAWVGWVVIGWWFFAGMPSAGLGFASCGHAKRRRRAVPV